jgi:hypothetical protein
MAHQIYDTNVNITTQRMTNRLPQLGEPTNENLIGAAKIWSPRIINDEKRYNSQHKQDCVLNNFQGT